MTWVLGIVLIALGVGVQLFVARRSFYRRNAAGLEQFKGFATALTTKAFEWLLNGISGILIIAGLFLLGRAALMLLAK